MTTSSGSFSGETIIQTPPIKRSFEEAETVQTETSASTFIKRSRSVHEGITPSRSDDEEQEIVKSILELGDDESVTCMLLNTQEWCKLRSSQTTVILRPFQSNVDRFVALCLGDEGHSAVAILKVGSCTRVQNLRTVSLPSGLYTKGDLERMKRSKVVYQWHFEEMLLLDPPHVLRFLDVAPRFRNRTFTCTKKQLFESNHSDMAPTAMCFTQTAKFFVSQMSETMRKDLADTVHLLDQQEIRIGTTCSGSDIIVPVIGKTIDFLNMSQANRCWIKL